MNASNPFDYNTADKGGSFDLIPAGTVAPMILTIRPGAAGDGGWLTASKTSDVSYLNVEFAVTAGKYRGRKIWQNMVVSGGKVDEGGASKAGNITRSTLRAILESARGIRGDDESPAAKQARMVTGYGDFSGLEFVGKIGIEKGSEGYPDKNKLLGAVGVEQPSYAEAKAGGSAPQTGFTAPAAKAPSAVPTWAQ
jgi:hypothetical protein